MSISLSLSLSHLVTSTPSPILTPKQSTTTPHLIRIKPRLKRPLSPRCQPSQMSPTPILPIQNCRVRSRTIIPHDHRPLFPFDSHLHICAERNVLVEEIEKVVGFFFFEIDDATGLEDGDLAKKKRKKKEEQKKEGRRERGKNLRIEDLQIELFHP